MLVMFLRPGLSGLVLLRELLRMPFGFLVVLPLIRVWSWAWDGSFAVGSAWWA